MTSAVRHPGAHGCDPGAVNAGSGMGRARHGTPKTTASPIGSR